MSASSRKDAALRRCSGGSESEYSGSHEVRDALISLCSSGSVSLPYDLILSYASLFSDIQRASVYRGDGLDTRG